MKDILKIIFFLNVMFASSILYSQSLTIRASLDSGRLGFGYDDIDEYSALRFAIPNRTSGAVIYIVAPNSVAESAGLLIGDVIISIDGERIREAEDFRTYFSTLSPDAEITLEILRFKSQDEAMETHYALQEYYMARVAGSVGVVRRVVPDDLNGVTVARNYPNGRNPGVVVTDIAPGSPAASVPLWRRLYVGDLIWAVDEEVGHSIDTPSKFWQVFENSFRPDRELPLLYIRRLTSQEESRLAEVERQEQAQARQEDEARQSEIRRQEEARQAEIRRQEESRRLNAQEISCSTIVGGLNSNEARVYLNYPFNEPLRLIDTVREIDVSFGTPLVRFSVPRNVDSLNGCTASMSMQDAATLDIGQRVDLLCSSWSEANGDASFSGCRFTSDVLAE